MNTLKSLFLGIVFLCGTHSFAQAQDADSKQSAIKINTTLLNATGAFEDAVGPALAKKDKEIAAFLQKADKESTEVKKALPAKASAEFTTLLKEIHKLAESGDHITVARDCMVVFRLLVDNLKTASLKIPKEVSLLDYAGYQMLVLTADKPDWIEITKLASDADGWWKAISTTKVTDKDLRAVMNSTILGLKSGAEEKNLSMVKLAARIDLDLVDLLESHLSSKK